MLDGFELDLPELTWEIFSLLSGLLTVLLATLHLSYLVRDLVCASTVVTKERH